MPEMTLEENFIAPDVLAAELHVSTRTLHRWHVLRIGPPRVAIGRTVLYRRESVRQWLESREESRTRTIARRTAQR